MLDRLRQFLGMTDRLKSPAETERGGYIDAIIEGKRRQHFAAWAEKQREDPACTASSAVLLAIHSTNFGQMEHGLREQYTSLPVEDLRRLAEHYRAQEPSDTKKPGQQSVHALLDGVKAAKKMAAERTRQSEHRKSRDTGMER